MQEHNTGVGTRNSKCRNKILKLEPGTSRIGTFNTGPNNQELEE